MKNNWKVIFLFKNIITCHFYYSDIHMVVVELGQGVYLQDQVKVDTERVDPRMVMEKVEVHSIIQKVNYPIKSSMHFSLLEFSSYA